MWRISVVLWTVLAVGCAGSTKSLRQQESELDTPEAHYRQGMQRLDAGDREGALESFRQAQKLDTDYPGVFVGFALIQAELGKFDEALRYVQTAKQNGERWADTYLAEGRVRAVQAKGDWLKEALAAFARAQKLNARDDRVPFYEGEAYRKAEQYQEAENAYSRAIDLKGPMQERAARALAQVQAARRAAPGTDVGIRVARLDPVRRGDLCQLLVEELKVEELVEKFGKKRYDTGFRPPGEAGAGGGPALPEDAAGHWAKAWIERVLALNVAGLEPYPDGGFKPDDPVTRKELARVLQGLLVLITGDEGLRTKYVGGESRFPDVRPDVYYYNAAALAVDRGLMQVDKLEGTFRPDDPVSGAGAVLAIKDLKEALMSR